MPNPVARGRPSRRSSSTAAQLIRLGFTDVSTAQELLTSADLKVLCADAQLVEALGEAADPDLALASLGRLLAAADECGDGAELRQALIRDSGLRERLIAVLGASEALGHHLALHPGHWHILETGELNGGRPSADLLRQELVEPVSAAVEAGEPWLAGATALRVAYRQALIATAARDLSGRTSFEDITAELADLADAVLAAGLVLAESELPQDAAPCRFAIIALGKCGARELNYISDVDVVFVAEPGQLPDGSLADEDDALRTASALARGVMRAANEPTPEGTIWEVDAALRPEGKSGALVRTLASHVGYYERWAQTWEFQALLKARFAAGDAALGAAYVDSVMPFVWSAANRPGFVTDLQAMRRRVEDHIPSKDADRELKLGKGGLRDVEFSVQMLQLVHGRSDVMLRSPTTLTALQSMATWGYVGLEDTATLTAAYRFLRTLEHRVQLFRMRRTHIVPDDEQSLRRIGRSMGMRASPAQELNDEWQRHRLAVRRLHEKLFYRPLLNAVARLGSGDARLTREAARERLMALGYADPEGALRHLEALTSGVSRRAAIQRTLLPVLLGWFADAPNPDAGLLAFRRVSDSLGGTPWYLRLLRDESETAERLAHIMASSRYATDLLLSAPEGVALLGDSEDLQARDRVELSREMTATLSRHQVPEHAIEAVRAIRRRELLRISAADISGATDVERVGSALSDVTDATLEAALAIATREVERSREQPLPTRFAVIGLGRLGGREAAYASDADVLFVHDPLPDADEHEAAKAAIAVANEMRRLLLVASSDAPLTMDADLRPEGRSGALVRTIASYTAYYARWSSPWEAQALLRARPIAGDPGVCAAFLELVDPLRWPQDGIAESDLREVRRLKARMESERLPKGVDPATHVKLGRGGLSDVEWVVQLMQMRFAGSQSDDSDPSHTLRVTGTLPALRAAAAQGYLSAQDAEELESAWKRATRVRNAVFLVTGRPSDQIPTDVSTRAGVAYLLGLPHSDVGRLSEEYLRGARHARTIVERLFYGWE